MSGLLTRAAGATARLAPSRHATILSYHGVEDSAPVNVSSAHVSIGQFQKTIAAARSVAEAVSLRELLRRHFEGRSTAGLFAVTFDDAYASLARADVRDIILGSGLPVTIFVVSGASATGALFWWDRIETLHRRVSPEAWSRFEGSIGLPKAYRTPASEAYGPLRPLRQWVLRHGAGRWPQDAEEALVDFERIVGIPEIQRPMSFDEIDSLVRSGPVDVGVHTVSHPVIPLLSYGDARAEILDSYTTLREHWPTTVPWLAAPFGLYDHQTSTIARECGLDGFLSVFPDTIARSSTVHGVPRMNIMEGVAPWKVAVRLSGMQRVLPSRWRRQAGRFPDCPAPD
jgi:peptidoglycan/xylan/chitin deacetylase (PgdA/CDA1 family)